MVGARSDARNAAAWATSSRRGRRWRRVPVASGSSSGAVEGSGEPGESSQATRIPVRAELTGQLATQAGESGPRDVGQPPRLGIASRPPPMARMTPASRGNHVPGDGGGQGHLGGDRLADGTQHVVVGHVDKGRALEVIVVDGVESDVDSPRISGDSVGMSLDCDAISCIELSDLRTSPDLGDAGCYIAREVRGCVRPDGPRRLRRRRLRATAEPIAPAPPYTMAILPSRSITGQGAEMGP